MKKNIIIIFIIVVVILATGVYLYISFNGENKNPINNTTSVDKKKDIKIDVDKNSENNNVGKVDVSYGRSENNETKTPEDNNIKLNKNIASENCIKIGGILKKEKTGKGTEFGVCYFDDGKACEEWALMNKDCPIGGVDTSMYDSDAEKLCLWLGAKIDKENDNCIFKYVTCKINDLYNEKCLP